ncbi:MAG: twin-arginine translocase TatA/TatE family subunit [Anaerolineales bacterium]|nr:MAG: twin-arginine translocase TatA/TatE family subunit [Anaerolineales bacterium]
MKNLGVPELILILVIAILIFGPGRIGKIGAELGKGIRGFKEGVTPEKGKETEDSVEAMEDSQEDKA